MREISTGQFHQYNAVLRKDVAPALIADRSFRAAIHPADGHAPVHDRDGFGMLALAVFNNEPPADGKLVVGLADLALPALGMGVLLEAVVFIVLQMRAERRQIPGALRFYTGSVLGAVAQVILVQIAVRASAPVML